MNSLLTNGNYFFTAVFAFESSIKLFAMSPRYFFAVIFIARNFSVNTLPSGWLELL